MFSQSLFFSAFFVRLFLFFNILYFFFPIFFFLSQFSLFFTSQFRFPLSRLNFHFLFACIYQSYSFLIISLPPSHLQAVPKHSFVCVGVLHFFYHRPQVLLRRKKASMDESYTIFVKQLVVGSDQRSVLIDRARKMAM